MKRLLAGSSFSGRRIAKLAPFVVLGALVAGLVYPIPAGAAASIRYVAKLQEPPEADRLAGTGRVMTIDEGRRRLYYQYFATKDSYAMHLREFDISGRIPRLLRDGRFSNPEEIPSVNDLSPNTVTLDTKRNRMYVLTVSGAPVGCTGDPFCGTSLPAPVRLYSFDLTKFERLETINVQVVVPGFAARGVTYSEQDDKLYMVGEIQPGGGLKLSDLTGAVPRTFPAAVVAIDAATASLSWVRVVPECDVPLATLNNGVLIRRSAVQPALYFACARPFIYPGMSGIIRVRIDPEASLAAAQEFPIEFFPISGSYVDEVGILGLASFDQRTDRFYMQSLARGAPGAWVFDGAVSAWVGFIVSPDPTNGFAGLNQSTGRFYMGGAGYNAFKGFLVISDGRRTPVPQGSVLDQGFAIKDQIHVDGATRRVFMNIGTPTTEADGDWVIFEDLVGESEHEEPTDYDSLTIDVPESDRTLSTFAGDTQGWGVRAVLVGGRSGLLSFCSGLTSFDCEGTVDDALEQVPEGEAIPSIALFKGTRAVSASRVASLDVRNVGAAASAQALALDPISDAEYREKVQKTAHDRAASIADEETAEQVEMALNWPHLAAACLDAQGKKVDDEQRAQGGYAEVTCNLPAFEAKAASGFDTFALGDAETPVRISIGSSSFSTRSYRDPKLGVATETIAIANAVSIGGQSLGSIAIGRVVSRALTSAQGRPGTSSAEWTRTFEHVIVRSATGDTVFECSKANECSVQAAIDAMNDVLKTRVRVAAPEAQLVRSPRGAFASVEESEKQYLDGFIANEDENHAIPGLEVTVFNDGVQRSRLVVQLAALQSSSIYGISLLASEGPGSEPGPPILGPSLGPLPAGPDLPIIDPPAFGPIANGGPVVKLARTAIFLVRSPKQAFLFGLTTLIFALAFVVGWRRFALMRELGGGS